jgi:hypothetical protein
VRGKYARKDVKMLFGIARQKGIREQDLYSHLSPTYTVAQSLAAESL